MCSRQCALLDLRGHAGEIFDADYRSLLRDMFTRYGESNVHVFTDATPFRPLFATVASSSDSQAVVDAFEDFVRDGGETWETKLLPRGRFASDRNVFMPLRNFLVDGRDANAELLPPLLRTLASARCAGEYLPDSATLKAALVVFLRDLGDRTPLGAPIDIFWCSHGNYLESPALDSEHGEYGVVAFRSAHEVETIADTSLTATWITSNLILPFAFRLRESQLLWSFHCCWSSGIVATIERELTLNGARMIPENLCILAEKPARSMLKANYVALYNDNFPFNPDICKPWAAATPLEALRTVVDNLRRAEIDMTADRVRLYVERDLKSRAVPSRRPLPLEGDVPAEVFSDGSHLRATHWPVTSTVEGTFKKRLADWKFGMENSVPVTEGDPRFIASYEAAAEAGCATYESWVRAVETASSASAIPQTVPLNLAFAAALRDAAGALRHESARACELDDAHAALDEGTRTGLHEAHKEAYWLAARRRPIESTPSGGGDRWSALCLLVDGTARPGFFSRLRGIAHASAELCASYAPRRLDALAKYVDALKPCYDSSTFLRSLNFILNSDANTKGEQSSGDIRLPHRAVVRWLFDEHGGTAARDLEQLLWANFAFSAAGGYDAENELDEIELGELRKFPGERWRLLTGLVVIADDRDLKEDVRKRPGLK